MKVPGSPLSKEQMNNVKGGQKKTCTAICYHPNFPSYTYVYNLDECSVAPAVCQGIGQFYAGCHCEPGPQS